MKPPWRSSAPLYPVCRSGSRWTGCRQNESRLQIANEPPTRTNASLEEKPYQSTEMKLTRSGRRDLHCVADLLKPSNEAIGGFLSVGAVEVGSAQIVPLGAVA